MTKYDLSKEDVEKMKSQRNLVPGNKARPRLAAVPLTMETLFHRERSVEI